MKNEIKNDLEELVSLIESEEDFAKLIDTTPIQNAINSLASSKNCFYDIQNLSFDINKKIKKIHPDVDKVNYFLLFLVRSRRGVGRAFFPVLVYRFKILFLRFILCISFRGRIDNVLIGIMNGKLI